MGDYTAQATTDNAGYKLFSVNHVPGYIPMRIPTMGDSGPSLEDLLDEMEDDMKLSSRDKLILAEALCMFIKKAWKDFELLAQSPMVKQSKLIELENHNRMLADLLVRLMGKERATKKVQEMIDALEEEGRSDGADAGGEGQECS